MISSDSNLLCKLAEMLTGLQLLNKRGTEVTSRFPNSSRPELLLRVCVSARASHGKLHAMVLAEAVPADKTAAPKTLSSLDGLSLSIIGDNRVVMEGIRPDATGRAYITLPAPGIYEVRAWAPL